MWNLASSISIPSLLLESWVQLCPFSRGLDCYSQKKMKDTLVDSSTIDEIAAAFSSLSTQIVAGLKEELPSYKAAVNDIDPSVDAQDWWKRHEQELPYWYKAWACPFGSTKFCSCRKGFSLLQNSFSQRQSSSLEDYTCRNLTYVAIQSLNFSEFLWD